MPLAENKFIDKAYGCWLGKCAGGKIGAKQENNKELMNYTFDDVFPKHNKCWANEYRVAIRNIEAGIYPPNSGVFQNDFFKNSMGCPIRSELWALVCPGNPELAAEFACMDGCDYFTVYLFAPQKATVAVGLNYIQGAMAGESIKYPHLFALIILSIVPILTIFIIFQRTIMDKMALGGIKG